MKAPNDLEPANSDKKFSYDEAGAKYYRDSEEKSIQFGSRQHYCRLVKELSGSFQRRISALDIGCGTGRYFHCFQNVERLLGLDLSQSMLDQARDPVKKDEITVEEITLLCGDIFQIGLPGESFDLIVSIGVLGEDAPFDLALCNKLHGLLKPQGQLFMTVADSHSRLQHLHSISPMWKRRIMGGLFLLSPPPLRKTLNKRQGSFYLTQSEVAKIFERSRFSSFHLERYVHPAGSGWEGAHFDCRGSKD